MQEAIVSSVQQIMPCQTASNQSTSDTMAHKILRREVFHQLLLATPGGTLWMRLLENPVSENEN